MDWILRRGYKPLVLIVAKMSGYVKTFKVKGDNKLMSLRIEDEKLFENYKAIWTKIENLKIDIINAVLREN